MTLRDRQLNSHIYHSGGCGRRWATTMDTQTRKKKALYSLSRHVRLHSVLPRYTISPSFGFFSKCSALPTCVPAYIYVRILQAGIPVWGRACSSFFLYSWVVFRWVQGKRNSYSLLMGVQVNTVITEITLEVPQHVQKTLWPSYTHPSMEVLVCPYVFLL